MGWSLGNEQRTANSEQSGNPNELSLYSLRFRESRAIVEA